MINIKIPFTKMTGTGNDFLIMDTIHHRLDSLKTIWPQLARVMCDQREGIGADGLLVLSRLPTANVRMRIFNPDGTEPSMCGNGIRCLAFYAFQKGIVKRMMTIETKAGIKRAEIVGVNRVRIDMGVPRFVECFPRSKLRNPKVRSSLTQLKINWLDFIDSGVPHLVLWVDDIKKIDVRILGSKLRHDRYFYPQGTNVDFVEYGDSRDIHNKRLGVVIHHYMLKMRIYERGVENETRACGTGAVAAAVSVGHQFPFSCIMGHESDVEWFEASVSVPGGILQVRLCAKYLFNKHELIYSHVFLEGQVRQVSQGIFAWKKEI